MNIFCLIIPSKHLMQNGSQLTKSTKKDDVSIPLFSPILRLTAMSSFLMSDVRMYDFNGVITECFGPKPILPFKIFWNDVVFVDEIRGTAFNLLYNFSQRNIWIQHK